MIDTETTLKAFLQKIHAADWIALDTEADSLHAYPEKVCLIQISTACGDDLLDPLAGIDLAPLLDALARHELIMHGADYDLRLFCRHHKFVPTAIFDTMLAARLLGLRQFSLSHLVETYLGVKLEKGAQKANWALRPLTERMERYALNDTHYLKPLADRLKNELLAKGRLAWHQESCATLIAECAIERPSEADMVWRIKGSHLLSRQGLAILRELWLWRESEALASNRPPFFVLSHDALVDIAEAAATHRPVEPLVPKHLSERRRAGLAKSLTQALQIPADRYPEFLKSTSRRPSEAERRRFVELQKHRDSRAGELGIDPTLIASRATLSDLAHAWDKHFPSLMRWQRELLQAQVAAA